GLTREQRLERRIVRSARRADFPPGALLRFLVVAEAEKARPVAEPVPLHLVVADFGNELRSHRRLFELTAAPTVRLGEPARRRTLEQRQHAVGDRLVPARGDRG